MLKEYMSSTGSKMLLLVQMGPQSTEERIVGTAHLSTKEGTAKLEIGMVAISPALQGKGLGKKLLHAVEAVAKEKYIPKMQRQRKGEREGKQVTTF